MTAFKDHLEVDLQAVFLNTGEYAATVEYAGAEVPAVITYGSGDEYKGYDDFDVRATVIVRVSDVPAVITSQQLVIGTATWEVIGARLSGCGRLWEIQLNRRTS